MDNDEELRSLEDEISALSCTATAEEELVKSLQAEVQRYTEQLGCNEEENRTLEVTARTAVETLDRVRTEVAARLSGVKELAGRLGGTGTKAGPPCAENLEAYVEEFSELYTSERGRTEENNLLCRSIREALRDVILT